MRPLPLLLICLLVFFTASAQGIKNPSVFYDLAAKRYGYIDVSGKVVIAPKYSTATPFIENLACVRISTPLPGDKWDDKWGFINRKGEEVIPFMYTDSKYMAESVCFFAEGLAPVSKDGKWGFIDQKNRTAIPFQYEFAFPFSEGLAAVVLNGKMGFINKAGSIVIPFIYHYDNYTMHDKVVRFSEGLAAVDLALESNPKYGQRKWAYIDKTGKTVIDASGYNSGVRAFSDGMGLVASYVNGKLKYGYIDKTGKEIVPLMYERANSFKDGMARVNKGAVITTGGRYGFIDKTGREVVPLVYDYAEDFSEGLAAVSVGGNVGIGGKGGYINKAGNIVIPLEYYFTKSFSEGVALVMFATAKYASINKEGKVIKGAENKVVPGASSFSYADLKKGYQNVRIIAGGNGEEELDYAYDANMDKDYKLALQWFTQAADKGNMEGTAQLGFMYLTGEGGVTDVNKGMKLINTAADKDNVTALYLKGLAFKFGEYGSPKDPVMASNYFGRAAAKGHKGALKELTNPVSAGTTTPAFIEKGAEEYKKGIAAVKAKDLAGGMDWYKKAIDKGNTDAMISLGLMHQNGNGTPINLQEAMKWYRMSADQKNALGMINVGVMYHMGFGVIVDGKEALKWYQQAAALNRGLAFYNIGLLYEAGVGGIAKDDYEARRAYTRGAELGEIKAMTSVGVLLTNGRGGETNYSEGLRWFELAAANGNVASMYNLGIMHESNTMGFKNLTKAMEWYKKAADNGDKRAPAALIRVTEAFNNPNN